MKPVDPRLLKYARTTRVYLAVSIALGITTAVLIVFQATVLAGIISKAFFGAPRSELTSLFMELGLIAVARALLVWGAEANAQRCSAMAKSELRRAVLSRIANQPFHTRRTGELAAVVTNGIDALDGFFSRYLSQLVLAAIIPIVLLGRIAIADWISVVALVVVIPLIPVFMILIGKLTVERTTSQFEALAQFSGHFLELLRGLPTLRLFNKAKTQARGIETSGETWRKATMSNLRIAFLSSFVLELLASIGVAFAAVTVGLRLVDGKVNFETALVVLFLAPEIYVPLRQVGAQFHANADGMAAANAMFEIIEAPLNVERGTRQAPRLSDCTIAFHSVEFCWPGRAEKALSSIDLELNTRQLTALMGPSGAGKSTLMALLLGFIDPTAGSISVDGMDLRELDVNTWRSQIAWVPQRAHLFAGTIANNIRIGKPDATDAEVARAADAANVTFCDLDAEIGERGVGISAGERQRVALARAFIRDAAFIVFDEPTEHLDDANAQLIGESIRHHVQGRGALLITHQPAFTDLADRLLVIRDGVTSDYVDVVAAP